MVLLAFILFLPLVAYLHNVDFCFSQVAGPLRGKLIVAAIFLIIFPPIAWALLWPLYRILAGTKSLKLVRTGPGLIIQGFFLGFLLMILGYLPAVFGGFILMYKITSFHPGR